MNHIPDKTPLETALGYRFRQPELLQQALTHPSCNQNDATVVHNQRLEFLGDAVLGLLLADQLYREHPDDEGTLTVLRSQCASGNFLAKIASSIALGNYLQLSAGAEGEGLRQQPQLLAAAFEALLGAAWLDGGLAAAQTVYKHLIQERAALLQPDPWANNPKGELQDLIQSRGDEIPRYSVTLTEGPAHNPRYYVSVTAAGLTAEGYGHNKREAETDAATNWLKHYR